jgi:hypothetical protein
MSLTRKAKAGVVVAAAAASLLGGVGLADATVTGPDGVRITASPGTREGAADVGVPPEGVHPEAQVSAPNGTRISSTAPDGFRAGQSRKQMTAAASANTAAAGSWYAYTSASDARIRASVPSGTVLATVRYGAPGNAGCKIPGRDGFLWGWVGFDSQQTGRFTYGWMRGDLFQVALSGGAQGGASYLPWC